MSHPVKISIEVNRVDGCLVRPSTVTNPVSRTQCCRDNSPDQMGHVISPIKVVNSWSGPLTPTLYLARFPRY